MIARSPTARSRAPGLEYGIYFAAVFLISLAPALIRMAVPRRGTRRRFFVTHAWAMADEVTPRIFSAF
ncbi:MAG: cytochrome PufQ [Pseudomonadota bacterium]